MLQFTKSMSFLDHGEESLDYFKVFDKRTFLGSIGGLFPSAYMSLIDLLQKLSPKPAGADVIRTRIQEQINSHQGELEKLSSGPADFVSKMLDARNQNPDRITLGNVRTAAIANIFVGSDTTSISLSGILGLLYQHPEVLARLRNELDVAQHAGLISEPIKFKEAQSLPFLQAVIREGLRCHSAIGVCLPRVIPKGGCVIGSTLFPEGVCHLLATRHRVITDKVMQAVVGVNAWVAHSNQEVWGPDAEFFKPDRWLQPLSSLQEQNFLPVRGLL